MNKAPESRRGFAAASVIVVALGLAGGLAAVLTMRQASRCTGEIIRVNTALAERKRALEAAAEWERQAACAAHREYVSSLREARPVSARCGPSQSSKPAAWPSLEAELAFHERVPRERCS